MRSVLCFVGVAVLALSAPAAQAASMPNVPKMISNAWAKVSSTVKGSKDAKAETPAPVRAEEAARATDALVLFSGADWSGRQVTLTGDTPNLGALNFNNRTRSARIPAGETWELCSDRAYRGHCIVFTGEVRDLKAYQMIERITSARKLPKGPDA